MKNKKSVFLIVGSLFIIIIISLIIVFSVGKNKEVFQNYNEKFAHLPKVDMTSSFIVDISTPENAIDYYPYAFVAKVNKVIKTDYRDPIEREITADGSETKLIYKPYTIYDITVIENLKGEIVKDTNITIEQVGGVSQDNDYVIFPTNMEFLKENYYYILLPYSPTDTDGLRLESSYNVIELGELTDKETKKLVFEIAKEQDFEIIDDFYNEKNDKDEIKKILTYKHASMTPTDMGKYENMAEQNGIQNYKEFYFATNKSKYDVNYKELIESEILK